MHRFTHDISSIVVPLSTSIHQQVQLSFEGCLVGHIVQSRGSPSTSCNRMVGHLLSSISHTSLQESSLKLSLVDGRLGLFQNSPVANVRHVVGLADHGNLELVLDNTGDLNGLLQSIKVLLLELEECDVVRDLVRDRVSCQLRGKLDLVDIVLLEGLVDAEGKTGPDDAIGIDGRNKEDRLGGLDIVDVVAVG